jgi:hypothetical protein
MQFTPETKKKIHNWCHRVSTVCGFAFVLLPDMQDFQNILQTFMPEWAYWGLTTRIFGGAILLASKLDSLIGRIEKKLELKSDLPAASPDENTSQVLPLPAIDSPREVPGSEDITQVIPRTDPTLSQK